MYIVRSDTVWLYYAALLTPVAVGYLVIHRLVDAMVHRCPVPLLVPSSREPSPARICAWGAHWGWALIAVSLLQAVALIVVAGRLAGHAEAPAQWPTGSGAGYAILAASLAGVGFLSVRNHRLLDAKYRAMAG